MVLYTDLVNLNIGVNMLVTEGKTQVILDNLREVQYMEECSEYGDQGYRLSSGTRIAFANWNDISDNVQKYLELNGYELQWNDEWIINYETDKCYRCSPDSYSWTPYYHITDGENIGGDEIETDTDIAIDEVFVLILFHHSVKIIFVSLD